MKPVARLPQGACRDLVGVLCDIDDTLTWEGKLVPAAFHALWELQAAGLKVVPVTGRPAGWVDHIARMWPVDGVVGENGGLWFYLDGQRMVRRFAQGEDERRRNKERLAELALLMPVHVPGAGIASDQPYRELDLAVDFCEDVPRLGPEAIAAIEREFRAVGATSKVSSIHVNGWYGQFDKLAGCRALLAERWGVDLDAERERWLYVGDSPNDEPMFAFFPHAVGVANVRDFVDRMRSLPAYVTDGVGGHGFAEVAARILAARG
ncbi:MAG: HAD-IIB family hydrolase [Myxococcota bacterium]